jgi:Ca2+-binding EF-hand superfamily protein
MGNACCSDELTNLKAENNRLIIEQKNLDKEVASHKQNAFFAQTKAQQAEELARQKELQQLIWSKEKEIDVARHGKYEDMKPVRGGDYAENMESDPLANIQPDALEAVHLLPHQQAKIDKIIVDKLVYLNNEEHQEDRKVVEDLFALVDADGNGSIDEDEFVKLYGKNCQKMWDMIDVNGDGSLSKAEFLKFIDTKFCDSPVKAQKFVNFLEHGQKKKQPKGFSRERSDALFNMFDKDGNGDIDVQEIVNAIASVKGVSADQLDRQTIQKTWDADGDGKITDDEFYIRMTRMEKKNPKLFAHFCKSEPQKGYSRKKSDAMFNKFDKDGNGDIDVQEIVNAISNIKGISADSIDKKRVQEAWDADGDGTITQDEFHLRMSRMQIDHPVMFAHFCKWASTN